MGPCVEVCVAVQAALAWEEKGGHPRRAQRGPVSRKEVSDDADGAMDGLTRELGCFCACALGRRVPRWRRHMTPRATRPRVTPQLTANLFGPS